MYIDLTVKLNDRTPVYPGDPQINITISGSFDKEGYLGHALSMGTHAGTHIDAPIHMIEGGKNLGDYPLDQFIGRGRYIQVINGVFNLALIQMADIQQGDIVLFDTGMGKYYYEPYYFTKFPVMPPEVADYLVEKRVKMIGIDTPSIDNSEGFPIHKKLLSNDVLAIENMTNLSRLAHKEFKVYALPLNMALDGAPARVIAEIEEDE